MKKTLLKIIPLLLVGSTLAAGCGSMYTSKADTKENMVGCYELDIYQSKKESAEEEPYDRKAEEGIVAYFTFDMDGYGYYGYKDNNTPARVDQIFATFTADDDEPEKFKAVSLKGTNQTIYYWEKKVGCLDEPPMGFNRGKDKTTLSYTLPWHEYTIYKPHKIQKYQYVCYKKVSDKTGYEEINRLLGTSYKPDRPYEMKYMMGGYYPYRCQAKEGSGIGSKGIYEYAVLDMNHYVNDKLTIYYSLAAEPGQKTAEVSVSIKEKGQSVHFEWNDKEFTSSASAFVTEFKEDADIQNESFTMWYSAELTLEEVIAQETAPLS